MKRILQAFFFLFYFPLSSLNIPKIARGFYDVSGKQLFNSRALYWFVFPMLSSSRPRRKAHVKKDSETWYLLSVSFSLSFQREGDTQPSCR